MVKYSSAPYILLGGLGFGIIGDLMLSDMPWGLGFSFWIVSLMLSTAALADHDRIHPSLIMPVLFFAGAVAVRDDPMLRFFNVVAVLSIASLVVMQYRNLKISATAPAALVRGLATTVGAVPRGLQYLFRSTPHTESGNWRGSLKAAAIGIAFTGMVGIVFIPLLASADQRFANLISALIPDGLDSTVEHAWWIAVFGGLAAGYLGEFTRSGQTIPAVPDIPKKFGLVEIGLPLGTLTFLFTTFSILQIPYLFGGTGAVLGTPGLTYADYARSGFFELCAAAGLTLPTLLIARALLDRNTKKAELAYRSIAGVITGLVLLLLVSATHRMLLYWTAYGASLDRFYASSFMVWIGTVTIWFSFTTLRGRHEKLAIGGITSAFVVLGLLNAINPSAIVATSLTADARFSAAADCDYLKRMSADAAPALVRAVANDPDRFAKDGCDLGRHLVTEWHVPVNWSAWNLGRERAARSVSKLSIRDIDITNNPVYREIRPDSAR